MSQPSVRLIKRFTYRGQTQEWSNTYHFTGDAVNWPSPSVRWTVLMKHIAEAEVTCYPASVELITAIGYTSDGTPAAFIYDFTTDAAAPWNGTFTPGSTDVEMPGDVAIMGRWQLDKTSRLGKQIYLRKFFHGVYSDETTNDAVSPDQQAAIASYMDTWARAGFSDNLALHYITSADNHGIGPHAVAQYLSTRRLKRRGSSPL